jgi:hypothetical protein
VADEEQVRKSCWEVVGSSLLGTAIGIHFMTDEAQSVESGSTFAITLFFFFGCAS